jgi:hypothetical protein
VIPSLTQLVEELDAGLEREDPELVSETARTLRETIARALGDRRLQAEDPILARRRRLHQRLEVLEAKAQAGRFDDADDDLDAVREMAHETERALKQRPAADTEPEPDPGPGPDASLHLARREARATVTSLPGAVVGTLSLLVFTLALQASLDAAPRTLAAVWANARTPALALAPLAGLLVGIEGLDDVRAGRIWLSATSGLSRTRIVVAEALGALAALAALLLGPAVLVILVGLGLGLAPDPTTTAPVLGGLFLLATSFTAIAFAFAARPSSRSVTLAGTLASYLCLGPIWEAAFAAGQAASRGREALVASLLRGLSPVRAADALLSSVDPSALPAGRGLLVLAGWTVAGLALAAYLVQQRGFGRPHHGEP